MGLSIKYAGFVSLCVVVVFCLGMEKAEAGPLRDYSYPSEQKNSPIQMNRVDQDICRNLSVADCRTVYDFQKDVERMNEKQLTVLTDEYNVKRQTAEDNMDRSSYDFYSAMIRVLEEEHLRRRR